VGAADDAALNVDGAPPIVTGEAMRAAAGSGAQAHHRGDFLGRFQ
jgi:hypothetical protein